MLGHNCDNVCTKLTYFCSHKNSYISHHSYFNLFDHILGLLLCIKTLCNIDMNTEIKKNQPMHFKMVIFCKI